MIKKQLFFKKNKLKISVESIFFFFLAMFLFFILFNSFAAVSQKVDLENQRLKKIENQIQTVKSEIKNLEKKESGYLSSLQKIEKLLVDTQEELKEIENDLRLTENDLRSAEEECAKLQLELKKKIHYLEDRLREIYKHQRIDYLMVLLDSINISDFLSRYKYISKILSVDVKLINDIREKSQHLEEVQNSLKNRKEVLRLLKEEVEKEKENIAYSVKAKKSIIQKIDSQKKAYLKSLEELEQSSEEIKNIIERMHQETLKSEKANKVIPTLKAKKGILSLPLQGKIISEYGRQKNEDFNTFTFNSGIDISAPIGEIIRSAGSGEVIYTGWIKGYGQIIIINHGGRMSTLYAHLHKTIIKNGEKVQKGQIIGQVGESGSVSSPRLHFEVRLEGKPTDPMNWL